MAYMIYAWNDSKSTLAKTYFGQANVLQNQNQIDRLWCLVLDGNMSLPFNDGSTASFEIQPEYSLKNIILQ